MWSRDSSRRGKKWRRREHSTWVEGLCAVMVSATTFVRSSISLPDDARVADNAEEEAAASPLTLCTAAHRVGIHTNLRLCGLAVYCQTSSHENN
jgi:hypothetical protein